MQIISKLILDWEINFFSSSPCPMDLRPLAFHCKILRLDFEREREGKLFDEGVFLQLKGREKLSEESLPTTAAIVKSTAACW